MARDERPDDDGIPMPSSVSSAAPAAPVSQAPARSSGPPTIDAHGNIRLNGAQVVKIVSSSDKPGTSKEVQPGVWQVTIDQNWLMTDEWGWFGVNKSGQFFFQKRVKSEDVVFNNGGAGLFQSMDYDKPIVIQDGTNVRVKARGLRLWLS